MKLNFFFDCLNCSLFVGLEFFIFSNTLYLALIYLEKLLWLLLVKSNIFLEHFFIYNNDAIKPSKNDDYNYDYDHLFHLKSSKSCISLSLQLTTKSKQPQTCYVVLQGRYIMCLDFRRSCSR